MADQYWGRGRQHWQYRPREYPEAAFEMFNGPRYFEARQSSTYQQQMQQEDSQSSYTKPVEEYDYEPRRIRDLKDLFKDNFEKEVKIKQKNGLIFDIAGVQSFILFYLQTRIVGAIHDLCDNNRDVKTGTILRYLTARTHEYCDAVRDMEYIWQWTDQKSGGDEDNLFELHQSRELERFILAGYKFIRDRPTDALDRKEPLLPGYQLAKKRNLEQLKWGWRLVLGIVTGGAIIGPVAIILFVNVKYKNLITTCGFVGLIAITLAVLPSVFPRLVPDLRIKDAITITAAYASVLVVFVGTKTQM